MNVFLAARPGLALSNEAAGAGTVVRTDVGNRVIPITALHDRLAA